jgi:DNA-binding beta-propeller fold protein YncE
VTSTVTKPETSAGTTPETTPETKPARPYALLRAGFPFYATLGMRRVTTYCVDVAIGAEGRLYVLCRDESGGTIRRTNWDDEDLGTIGGAGREPGKFQWPVQLVRDDAEHLYVSDEGLHRITILAPDGTVLGHWGEHGAAPGQLDRPSGIAFDGEGHLWVADTMNHRLQRFTTEGQLLSAFGRPGQEAGQLNMPWGVAVDEAGDVYVGDWGNHRVQKFSPQGDPLLQLGRPGSGRGELKGPAGIAVDADGDIYVADRGNHRVQQFDHTGRFVEEFLGDATLSKSGRTYIMANPKVLRAREMTSLGPAKRLRGPASVRLDGEGRMYIPDFGSHRIQVYRKEAYPLTPEEIWPEPKAPFLYTV